MACVHLIVERQQEEYVPAGRWSPFESPLMFLLTQTLVGRIVVGVIVALALLFMGLRWFAAYARRKFVRQVLNAFPSRVWLRRQETWAWRRPELVQNCVEALHRLGFEDAGIFAVEPLAGTVLQALVKPEESISAVVHEQPPFGTALDLTTYYQDGSRLVYTSNRKAIFLSQSPLVRMVVVNETDPVALYRKFVAERPQQPFLSVSAAEFPRRYERSWADSRDNINASGGFSLETIRKTTSGKGRKVTGVFAVIAWELLGRKRVEGLDIALRERFAAQDRASFDRFGDRLVFLNDHMTLADAADIFGLCYPDRARALRVRPGPARARRAFAAWNADLPAEGRFVRLGSLDQPVPADVYAAPGETRAQPSPAAACEGWRRHARSDLTGK